VVLGGRKPMDRKEIRGNKEGRQGKKKYNKIKGSERN